MQEVSKFTSLIKIGLEAKIDDRDPTQVSMSAIGHCARQLAYRVHGVEGTPLNWRAQMIFSDGDWHHNQLRGMLAKVLKESDSCFELVDEEKSVEFSGIGGHIDGILRHKETCKVSDPEHVSMLLEVKSMNDRAFIELKNTQTLPWEYRCQVSGYLAATGMKHAIILAKNKNTGDLLEFRYEVEHDILVTRMLAVDSIISSDDAEQVERDYHPNNRGNLPWQCNYCPFVKLCWRDYEVIEKKGRKYQINYKLFQAGKATGKEEGDNDQETTASG